MVPGANIAWHTPKSAVECDIVQHKVRAIDSFAFLPHHLSSIKIFGLV